MERKSILLIEDDTAITQTIQDLLELQGYRVFIAGNGKEGASLLKALSPPPCVILLDLMMPDTNGWDFLDFLKADSDLRAIPVVICSAYIESAKAIQLPFVAKPLQYNELMNAVRKFSA